MNTKTIQIAKVAGLYRCTGLGQTKFAKYGETLPVHTCKDVQCKWELCKEDNASSKDIIIVFIGRKGIFHTINTDELPEIGHRYNIRESFKNMGLQTGEHRVTLIDPYFRWYDKTYLRIEVERIGELSDILPIHQAGMMNV